MNNLDLAGDKRQDADWSSRRIAVSASGWYSSLRGHCIVINRACRRPSSSEARAPAVAGNERHTVQSARPVPVAFCLRRRAMRRQIIYLSIAPLFILFLVTAVSAQPSAPIKATAPEKMLPPDRAMKMRTCKKRAMQMEIKMEDRTSFVINCMADMLVSGSSSPR